MCIKIPKPDLARVSLASFHLIRTTYIKWHSEIATGKIEGVLFSILEYNAIREMALA